MNVMIKQKFGLQTVSLYLIGHREQHITFDWLRRLFKRLRKSNTQIPFKQKYFSKFKQAYSANFVISRYEVSSTQVKIF